MGFRWFSAALAAALTVCFAGPQAEAGLIAYYTFDGSNANDLSVNGNNGIVGAGASFSTNTPNGTGRSLSVTGSGNSIVTVPNSYSLAGISNCFSISFWMDSTQNSAWVRIFQHGNEANGGQTWLVDRFSSDNNTNVRVDTGPSGFNQNIAVNPAAPVFDGTWHQVAFVVNNGSWAKYLDGLLLSTGSYTVGTGFSNTQPLYIGGQFGNGNYAGLLDQVALFDTPLSAGDVKLLYQGVSALDIPEPATLTLLGLGALGLLGRRRRTC